MADQNNPNGNTPTEEAGQQAAEEILEQVVEAPEPANERLIRLMADFENFRRRAAREKNQEYQRGRRDAAEKLLPVWDSLAMGMLTMAKDSPQRAGLEAVQRQLLAAFEQIGIRRVDAVGFPFDPQVHEAIANMPSPKHPEGVVCEESRAGFADEIGLLRAAQVLVSSGSPSA